MARMITVETTAVIMEATTVVEGTMEVEGTFNRGIMPVEAGAPDICVWIHSVLQYPSPPVRLSTRVRST